MKALLTTVLLFALSTGSSWAKDFSDLKVGEILEVKTKHLHPTQFNIGEVEMREKQKNFEKMSAKELKKYLKDHPCPVVIGPDGRPYITDEQHRANASEGAENSHHAARALREGGEPTMYMKVVANYSHLSQEEFEKAMIENNYTFLHDHGEQRPFKELPDHVDEMGNDAYRSLAGFLERKEYALKPGVYFSQFKVADWLREKMGEKDKKLDEKLKDDRKKILESASELLQSPEAKTQPWFMEASECAKAFE